MEIPESIQADLNSLWVCEAHPWAEMGHDDCGGAGCPWNTQMHRAIQFVERAYAELEGIVKDASIECCGGIAECFTYCLHRQLREYLGKEN